MFSIGEFSRATGLTVKSLRYYHEEGILEPSHIDSSNGYRYYAADKLETAGTIAMLRELDFSIVEIADLLKNQDDEPSVLGLLESKQDAIQSRMKQDRKTAKQLSTIIQQHKDTALAMGQTTFSVERKTIEPITVASMRIQGKYSDCGKGFGKIGQKFGRYISGKPMLLHFDSEYREDDANFAAAMPVRGGQSKDGIEVQELPGGECMSLMHLGPYEELRTSYAKIIQHMDEHEFPHTCPSREIYHKGPGMIFRGNPKKYLTEIQFFRAP